MSKESIETNLSAFFNVSKYSQAAIFEGTMFVWDALKHLESYIKKQVNGKIETEVPEGAFLINPEQISIGEGTQIEPGAYIKGPCIIGRDCVIRHGAYIRGNVLTGDKCVIGHDTEVKNTIFLDKAYAAHFAYLGDCILGNNTNLGAGVKCANLKIDHGAITIRIDDRVISTGMHKLGAIIGDGCQLGCNSVTNPGTLMGKNSCCYPCTNFGGYVPENMLIKQPQKNIMIKLKEKHAR